MIQHDDMQAALAKTVIDHGLSLGAEFVELFVERHFHSRLSTVNERVDTVQSDIEFGVGIRLVYGSEVLYGYTNSANADELQRIITLLVADRQKPPSLRAQDFRFQAVDDHLHKGSRALSQDPEIEDKIAFLHRAQASAREAGDAIAQIQGVISQREQRITIFNSEGLHTADTRPYMFMMVIAMAQGDGVQATGQMKQGAMAGWEFSHSVSADNMGAEAARQALVNLAAKPCPSGRMPVVIGNAFGGVIFHEACGHLLETTSVAKQASVFHDKLGEMIANPVVNAVDDGTMTSTWGSIAIDDEGTPTQRTQLISNGKLVSFLADRLGGKSIDHAPTGSGRRQNYRFAPTSRMRNTFIEAGDSSLEDMLSSLDTGIYATHMGGGSVQPGTGEFNFAVQEGYYVEKGKVVHPIKAATLTSSGPEVLQKISMVGKDLDLACGMCGSISGAVPTTVGQPSLRVDDILVGGMD